MTGQYFFLKIQEFIKKHVLFKIRVSDKKTSSLFFTLNVKVFHSIFKVEL